MERSTAAPRLDNQASAVFDRRSHDQSVCVMEQSTPLLEKSGSNNTDLALSASAAEKPCAPRATTWTTYLTRVRLSGILIAFLPRYMQPGGLRRKKGLTPSAYLDALRGYAALIVVNYHVWQHQGHTWLVQLPFFRLLVAGRGMVDVFFVISGYVLSYRLLMLTRNEDGRLLDGLASSTFRRYSRLFGSTGAATFIAMMVVWLGWIEVTDGIEVTGRKETFLAQIWDWWLDLAKLSNPFTHVEGFWYLGDLNSRYLNQLWTIPVEFRGSLVVFFFCAAACKLSARHRMTLTWILVIACCYWRTVYAALFLSGMWIADVSLGRHPERLKPVRLPQQQEKTAAPQNNSVAARIGYVIILIVGLFFLSQAEDLGRSGPWPWQHLSRAIPAWGNEQEHHFFLGIGAFLLVLALESYPALQKPLTWNFSQYLGELSFGIYTMHELVIWSLYDQMLKPWQQTHLGDSLCAVAPGMIIIFFVVLWAADFFTRIDNKVVRLGRYVQSVAFVQWKE